MFKLLQLSSTQYGDGDFDLDSEPPPSSSISIRDGDAVVMTSMLCNVGMLLADNCLLAPNLIGDGDLDGTTTISGTPGGDEFEHLSHTMPYTGGVGDGDLNGDRARMSTRTLDAVGRAGDMPHRRSCGSGGDTNPSVSRARWGSGCARHTGHVECAHSQASMQRPWKKCRHGGSTRTTSPSSSSCRHTTHSTAPSAARPLLPLLLLLPPLRSGDGDADADSASRARYVNVGSAAMSSTLSPRAAADDSAP